MSRSGQLSVETGDIFPIIKKWLYSEHDIFLRELVANATDALTKRAAWGRGKNVEIPPGEILFSLDKDKKTLVIKDNGVGMTEEEVVKYIAQLAFSGAEEFVEKMKLGQEKGESIIGKFGLGFYSSFMVADKVVIETLSCQEGAGPTKWICEGDTEYTFEDSEKKDIGTTITLFINKESEEFLNDWKITDILKKFCNFMPYPIKVEKSERPKDKDASLYWDINETSPLWKKDPSKITEEDYKKFYKVLFPLDSDPLFWLHLKVDHPFTLEGILYFPKIHNKVSFQEQHINLYCRQVFVSDNVKEVIPEFLSHLKGSDRLDRHPLECFSKCLAGGPQC